MRRNGNTLQTLRALVEAQELIDKREYHGARDLLLRVRNSQPQAARSSSVSYWLAIVSDYLADWEAAVDYIEEALRADPLSVPFNQSFDIIVERIRRALAVEDRPAEETSTPRLYDLLLRTGEADMPTHLAMARHHVRAGNDAAAMRLLGAITTLDPTNAPAWRLYADAARRAGATAVAESAAFEASALEGKALPLFAIAGRAMG